MQNMFVIDCVRGVCCSVGNAHETMLPCNFFPLKNKLFTKHKCHLIIHDAI